MRAERGAANTLTIDAGDTIQGTPLAYYFAKINPISATVKHPMALAMNAIGYDAVGLGNHEFNYGIPLLRTWEKQLDFPLLGANVHDAVTGGRAFTPYVLKRVKTDNGWLTVGLVGFVTPGCALWDRDNVQGKLDFNGIVEEAKTVIPQVKAAGADIVIVTSHSGATPGSSYGDALPFPENASTQLAEEVPGIDAILVGHAHLEIPERFVTNKATGKQVLLTEPLKWGMRVSVMDLELAKEKGQWTVTSAHSLLLDAKTVDADPAVVRAVQAGHEATVKYVNEVIGTSTAPLSTATACWEDSAAIDAINYVQASTIKAELANGPAAGLPVLSIAAAFSRAVDVKAGPLTIRDVAGLYIFDNTLLSIKVTGAQVKAYLEWSAQYFKPVTSTTARAAGRHQRRDRRGPERHAGLQLRRRLRTGRAAELRDRPRPAGRGQDRQAELRRPAAAARAGIRPGHQQLPAERRRQLPGRQERARCSRTASRRSGSASSTTSWTAAPWTSPCSARPTGASPSTGRRSRSRPDASATASTAP